MNAASSAPEVSEPVLQEAVRRLTQGELVAFPTESVYGLGADAENDTAVAAIYACKGRPKEHPLIVHVLNASSARRWVRTVTPLAQQLMARYWPGPLTLVLERAQGRANTAAAQLPTIALRAPAHPVARELLRRLHGGQGGIAAPSVNRFGGVSATRAEHVRSEFGETLYVLDGGACPGGIESTIVDARGAEPLLLRPGLISADTIARDLGVVVRRPDATSHTPRVSGSLASHYAPRARVRLLPLDHEAWQEGQAQHAPAQASHRMGALLWGDALPHWKGSWVQRLSTEPAGYAHALYDALRQLDAAGLEEILVLEPPDTPAWHAVRDRLHKAAAPR